MHESSNKDRYFQDRQLPRIRVPKSLVVQGELEAPDGTRWAARCIDIHIGGVLLEFRQNTIPDLKVENKVLVTIELDGERAANISSIVRHVVGRRLGLAFPDLSTQAPGLENHLSRIVRTIEREILREKRQE